MRLAEFSCPPEQQWVADDGSAEICERVAKLALAEAQAVGSRRFFQAVAVALGRGSGGHAGLEGAALAKELAGHVREPWVSDGLERGLALFSTCIDETGRRCVASLVAEYLGWREPPDNFFHRAGSMLARRGAAELVALAQVLAGYARTPKPGVDERRLLAAVPRHGSSPGCERTLTVLGFVGDPAVERLRSGTKVPSLGCEGVIGALADAAFCWHAEPGPLGVPIVGRALLWFPREADHDLRRLHLLLASAIV
jgi:hypothetical protein